MLKNLLDTEVSYVQSLQFLVSVGLLLTKAQLQSTHVICLNG